MKKVKIFTILLTLSLVASCQKDDMATSEVVNEEQSLIKFDNGVALKATYDSSFKYIFDGNVISDTDEINYNLKALSLICDEENMEITFLTVKKTEEYINITQKAAIRKPLIVTRGSSWFNGSTAEQYSYHNHGYLSHSTTRWAHHQNNHSYSGQVGGSMTRNLTGSNLNRLTIINHNKGRRVRFGLLRNNDTWHFFWVNKRSSKMLDVPGAYYKAHNSTYVN